MPSHDAIACCYVIVRAAGKTESMESLVFPAERSVVPRRPTNSPHQGREIIAPDRVVAERGDEGPMRGAVIIGDGARQRHQTLAQEVAVTPSGGGRASLNRGKIAIEFGPGLLVELPFQ